MKVYLSYLPMIGMVDKNTPWCVVQTLAKIQFKGDFEEAPSDLKTFDYLLNRINTAVPYTLDYPCLTTLDYPHVAKFLNGNCSWDERALIAAFDHVYRFFYVKEPPFPASLKDFIIGPPNSIHPISYSAPLLWKICKHLGLPTSLETSLEQMGLAVATLLFKVGDIRKSLQQYIRESSREVLVKTLITIPLESLGATLQKSVPLNTKHDLVTKNEGKVEITRYPDDSITFESLIDAYKSYQSILKKSPKWAHYKPRSQNEAVVISACQFQIDISKSTNAIQEYEHLFDSPYIPLDSVLQDKWRQEPMLLFVNRTFNPFFPLCLYEDESLLRLLALQEGFFEPDFHRSSPYELLQINALSSTFHEYVPNGAKETKLYRSDIDEFSHDALVSFGILLEPSKLIAFSYEELSAWFSCQKNYLSPLDPKEHFSPVSIRKLKNLAQRHYTHITHKGRKSRADLLHSLVMVEIFQQGSHEMLQNFHTFYHSSTSSDQQLVRDFLEKLERFSMSLRGWLGTGPYPLKVCLVDNQNDVDVFVSTTTQELRESASKLQHTFDLLSLPLMLHRNGEFILSSSKENGFTLGDRLRILTEGNVDDNLESCIRRSSNWFLSSLYRCKQILNIPMEYCIEDMREIS